jgi:hypothetical protein
MDNTLDWILEILQECIDKDLWFEINPDDSKTLQDYVKKLEVDHNKLDRIKNICDSIPKDWSIVGVEKIHEIEEIINEH